MPWIGSAPNQSYQRADGVRSGAAVNAQAKAALVNDTAALADARENDFADALSLAFKRDGGNQPTADLPMNSHKLTGLSLGTASTDSVTLGQVQNGTLAYAEAGGTANAITLATAIACTAVEGMIIGFVAEADSDAAVTVNLNTGGALALQVAGAACVGGEVQNGQFHYIGFDGTQWQLLNPLWPNLTALAGLVGSANALAYFTGAGAMAVTTLTAAGRALIDDADAAAQRTTLGVGTSNSPSFAGLTITGTASFSSYEDMTAIAAPSAPASGVLRLYADVADGVLKTKNSAGTVRALSSITLPTVQRFTSGSGTYTPAAGARYIRVRMVGGGGGGAAQNSNAGSNGSATTFGSWGADCGDGGAVNGPGGSGGSDGSDGTGTLIARFAGADGSAAANFNPTSNGAGGSSVFGGAGNTRDRSGGGAAKANTGSGGGAGTTSNSQGSGGGGAGEYVEFFVTAPSGTSYVVGGGGNGGSAGGTAGGNGGSGVIIVEEFY